MHNWFLSLSLTMTMLLCATMAHGEIYTLDEARELYKAGKYEEAAPTFAKELKRKVNNGSLNHWYGVCLYKTGRYEGAIPYLEKGASRKVTSSNFYLGRVYDALYRFDEAVDAYSKYFELLADDDKEPTEEENLLMSKAKLGKRMMRGVEQVQVIDSLLVDSLSFFNYYKLSPEAGKILGADKLPSGMHVNVNEVAFVPQRGDVLYMGHMLEDNYDLYQSGRLLSGEWSPLQAMSEVLNTTDNQNYPFLLNDGQTLYFSQDGENSLGGYDLFVTMFNTERSDYMLPQNMGMPFNSPHNDFMLAIDETIGVGWFVTDRNKIPGHLTIYIFIPNAQKRVYDAVEGAQLSRLAQLSSIADTWQDGSDYTSLLTAIDNIKEEEAEKIQEFRFVLCNGIVYTNSDDFHNETALRYYNQSRSAQQRLDDKQRTLSELRMQYARANSTEKKQLTERILLLEEEILNEYNEPMIYENRARNAELSYRNIVIE